MGSGIFVFMLRFIFCLYIATGTSSMIWLDVKRLYSDQNRVLAKPQQLLYRPLLCSKDGGFNRVVSSIGSQDSFGGWDDDFDTAFPF
ncbi:hypothetical protein [Paenibacillus bovis]|uniref:hypothetical protein n=1 Tax=Paenibacillus bovis TaxID=1616788 RepID=UPI001313F967|nr:hypothetical protein [Paenibacillus bovis]